MIYEIPKEEREWMVARYVTCLVSYAQIGKPYGLSAEDTRTIIRQTVSEGLERITLDMIDKLETSPKLRAKVAKNWVLTLNPQQIREVAGI